MSNLFHCVFSFNVIFLKVTHIGKYASKFFIFSGFEKFIERMYHYLWFLC